MPGRIQFRPDRQSGPLLASTVMVFLGAIAAATVVTASGRNPVIGLLLFVGMASVLPLFLLLLRASPKKAVASVVDWWQGRKARPKMEYQPRAVQSKRQYGTNRPPSAMELKEMKGGTNNWVPANGAAAPSPRRSSPPKDADPSKPS